MGRTVSCHSSYLTDMTIGDDPWMKKALVTLQLIAAAVIDRDFDSAPITNCQGSAGARKAQQ